jgi:hypothetical protein
VQWSSGNRFFCGFFDYQFPVVLQKWLSLNYCFLLSWKKLSPSPAWFFEFCFLFSCRAALFLAGVAGT